MLTFRDFLCAVEALRRGWVAPDELISCAAACDAAAEATLADVLVARGALTVERKNAIEEASQVTVVLPPPQAAAPSPADSSAADGERYALGAEIARGGLGKVMDAIDRVLKREVAVKLVLEGIAPELRERFVREAEVTAALDHPNVVPVHDFGSLRDRDGKTRLFLCMKRVRGRDLADLLRELQGNEAARRAWTRARLLRVFQDICLGIAYAHSKKILHRDLKPANVMIGDFGEVLIVDWGLAKKMGSEGGEARSGKPDAGTRGAALTLAGEILGTPAYMPPEQAEGRAEDLDERSDVYSLGALLYEILTLRPAFEDSSLETLLQSVRLGKLVSPSIRLRQARGAVDGPQPLQGLEDVPPELEAIVLRAMAWNPANRHASARDLHDEVQLFLEGVKERERRRELAAQAVERAREAAGEYRKHRAEAAEGRRREKFEKNALAPSGDREPMWAARDAARAAALAEVEAWVRTNFALSVALGHEPENAPARRLKAELEWEKFGEAEDAGDEAAMVLHRRAVEQNDDGGFAARLRGDGTIEVRVAAFPCACRIAGRRCEPRELAHGGYHPMSGRSLAGRAGAEGLPDLEPRDPLVLRVHGAACAPEPVEGADVWIFRYELVDRRLVPVTPPGASGPGLPEPVAGALWSKESPFRPRGPGLYLGRSPISRRPLPLGSWLLVAAHAAFAPCRCPVAIPRGRSVSQEVLLLGAGESPRDFLPLAAGLVAPHPDDATTSPAMIDHSLQARFPVTCAEYAAFLDDLDPAVAARRCPREGSGSDPYWKGPPWKPFRLLRDTAAAWRDDWPVLGISWEDALAFAAWRTRAEGFLFTLPLEREWVRAARGADRRSYPWGDDYNEPWSNTLYSHSEGMRPAAVSAFPGDESPWGVRHLAGNARAVLLNDAAHLVPGWRFNHGGVWTNSPVNAHIDDRSGTGTDFVNRSFGFRLACVMRLG